MSMITEGLRIAINSIVINKMRAGLTMLGIIIGVAAVISLVSLGRGVEQFVRDEFNLLGANMLIVMPMEPEADTRTRIEKITTEDVEALLRPGVAPGIRQIAPQYNIFGIVNSGGESMRTAVRGVTSNYPDVRNWEPQMGEFINQTHIENEERVAVIGPEVIEEIFEDPDYNPVGETIRVNDQAFAIIGVMEPRDEPFNNDNAAVLIPITTAQKKIDNALTRGGYEVSTMYVQAASSDATYDVEAAIDDYFWEKHEIGAPDERDYDIVNSAEQLEIVGAITATLTVFLGLIASVSLLVGGIGIMNIMLVTVTERTQEIGLRKAVGAQPRDIMTQFLFESTILSLIGGIIGIILGWVAAQVGTAQFAELTLTVAPDAVALATGVSTAVGVGFGLFPAWRAARMNPIDALRFE